MEPSLAIGVISRMKLMVSMRLHGLIFAAGQGVPIVGISYDPKVTAFLSYINQDLCIDFNKLSATELLSLIDRAAEKSDSAEECRQGVERLREIQHKNIEAAKRLLMGEDA
jgi:polysaccharide pyruvyl transferase WcaK-like protein